MKYFSWIMSHELWGRIMRRIIAYARYIASVGGLVALIIAGGKLADHNYSIIVEGYAMLACLSVLFIITVYNLSKQQK